MAQRLAAATGVTIWMPDLRGIGDLAPEFPRHYPGHARSRQGEEAYAWAALALGRPLLGQRVTDLLAVAAAVKGPKVVAARGSATVAARFAAALDDGIRRVLLVGGPASYRELLEAEEAGPTANLLFGALAATDLTDLAPERTVRGSEWSAGELEKFVSRE